MRWFTSHGATPMRTDFGPEIVLLHVVLMPALAFHQRFGASTRLRLAHAIPGPSPERTRCSQVRMPVPATAIANMLIQTCKLNDVEPLAWLTDVLQRIISGRNTTHQLGALLPWNWRSPTTAKTA